MINLNIQGEHQEQLDLFNSKYNQSDYYVKEIYTDRFIPFLKKLNEIEGNGYIELSKLLQILIEGFDKQVGENPSRYEESCLMTRIVLIKSKRGLMMSFTILKQITVMRVCSLNIWKIYLIN